MISVILPHHLKALAQVSNEIGLEIEGPNTLGSLLDDLESRFPMLQGTIRDPVTKQRRPFIRFFACGQDLSLESLDAPLPAAVVLGSEPFRIIGAMAGG